MPPKDCEAVPEGNCPIPQQEEFRYGEPTLADIYRLCEKRFDGMDSCFDRWNKNLDEIYDEMRKMDEHVTRLEHGARQPRLAMEADGPADTKTHERTTVPQQQYKRCVGMVFLLAGLNPAQAPNRPVSA